MPFRFEPRTMGGGMAMLPPGKAVRGFTLIELMIVVAVVAILAAIAYPSYTDSVLKSRRGQAKADMVEAAQMLERYHSEKNTYVGFVLNPTQSPKTGDARYTLALNPVPTQGSFTITATALGGQANDRCGNLSIDQAGVKTNSKGTLADCW